MKKWFFLAWLLIPVGLVSYHFGPGQKAVAYRTAQAHLHEAEAFEGDGHWDEAIDQYDKAVVALPAADDQQAELIVARDQLRLAQIRDRFRLGRLAESITSLDLLAADVERTQGPNSPLAYDVRDFLGRVHFQAMIALRLESADEAVWKRHWELSRQNFRFLAEHTQGKRNHLDRLNLEAVIKSAELPLETFASASASTAVTAGLHTPTTPPPPDAPPGGSPQTTTVIDARPRKPQPETPVPLPDEFDLGS